MSDWPKISIITPSYNQAPYLEETLRSVLDQGYPNLEYLVIDGGSTDGSVEILERYAPRLSYWVSEPDRGQSHAINKGLARATGEIIAYLNSDDPYLPGALLAAGSFFRRYPHRRWCCGHTMMFGPSLPEGRYCPVWLPRDLAACLYLHYQAHQPGHFWHRELFEQHGAFEEGLRDRFDHEFYIRLIRAGVRPYVLDYPIAGFRMHGESKTVSEGDPLAAEVRLLRERYEPELPRSWIRREVAASHALAAAEHSVARRWGRAFGEMGRSFAQHPGAAVAWAARMTYRWGGRAVRDWR